MSPLCPNNVFCAIAELFATNCRSSQFCLWVFNYSDVKNTASCNSKPHLFETHHPLFVCWKWMFGSASIVTWFFCLNRCVSPTKTLICTLKNLETEFSTFLKNFQMKSSSRVWTCLSKHIAIGLQEQLADIKQDGNLQAELHQKSLHCCWMGLKNERCDLVSAAIWIYMFLLRYLFQLWQLL